MKLLYYNSYILQVFDYACVVWGHGANTYTNKIFSIQRRAARIILAKSRGSTKTDLFHDLYWLSVDDRCRYHTIRDEISSTGFLSVELKISIIEWITYDKKWKTLWQKEKLHVLCSSSFVTMLSKSCLLQRRQKAFTRPFTVWHQYIHE